MQQSGSTGHWHSGELHPLLENQLFAKSTLKISVNNQPKIAFGTKQNQQILISIWSFSSLPLTQKLSRKQKIGLCAHQQYNQFVYTQVEWLEITM